MGSWACIPTRWPTASSSAMSDRRSSSWRSNVARPSARRLRVSSLTERYRKVAGQFTQRVGAVPDDAWANPAPCEGWVARDVVGHLVEWLPAFFFGTWGIDVPPIPSVDEDPVGAWAVVDGAIQAALDDPDTARRQRDTPMGRASFEQTIDRICTGDVLVHTWDLARATGLDESLDPDEVHRFVEGMEPLDELLRQAGSTAPECRFLTMPTNRPGSSPSSAATRSAHWRRDGNGRGRDVDVVGRLRGRPVRRGGASLRLVQQWQRHRNDRRLALDVPDLRGECGPPAPGGDQRRCARLRPPPVRLRPRLGRQPPQGSARVRGHPPSPRLVDGLEHRPACVLSS